MDEEDVVPFNRAVGGGAPIITAASSPWSKGRCSDLLASCLVVRCWVRLSFVVCGVWGRETTAR
jgi:hypothetical protein